MPTSDWEESPNFLKKEFLFESFEMAMLFMQQAAIRISEIDHHPEWINVYNRVLVKLTTHSKGNIVTEKDRKLAEILDNVYSEFA
jgi:4a-hydroxytetrahydrobiopterin dehydratase